MNKKPRPAGPPATAWSPAGTYKLTLTGLNTAGQTRRRQNTSFKTQTLALSKQVFPEIYPLEREQGRGRHAGHRALRHPGHRQEVDPEEPAHHHGPPSRRAAGTGTATRRSTGGRSRTGSRAPRWTVDADINGVSAGNGTYGQQSSKTGFTVGREFVIKVNLKTDYATVYKSGKKVRSIPVTGGKAGWTTRSGTKLIMAKEYNKVMTNEQIGAEEKYSLTAASTPCASPTPVSSCTRLPGAPRSQGRGQREPRLHGHEHRQLEATSSRTR